MTYESGFPNITNEELHITNTRYPLDETAGGGVGNSTSLNITQA